MVNKKISHIVQVNEEIEKIYVNILMVINFLTLMYTSTVPR